MGSIVLYMNTSEKTDRVIWQVTNTMGVPILGRTQAKLMNYISYPEIHAPKCQEQSPVSVESLKSTDYVYSLETTNSSLQSEKTAQSMDSLKITPTTNQTAQKEHRLATRAKSSTAHGPQSPQVSWCKNSVTINGKTHPLSITKEYILIKYIVQMMMNTVMLSLVYNFYLLYVTCFMYNIFYKLQKLHICRALVLLVELCAL